MLEAISSSGSVTRASSTIRCRTRLTMLAANIRDAVTGEPEARSVGPRTVTPRWSTSSSARVSVQFPPRWIDRSITSDPGRMASTMVSVIKVGLARPGICAAVTTTSASASRGVKAAAWTSGSSGSAPSATAMLRAPIERISSSASGRMSKPSTIAPSRRAMAMDWRPATPAPSTTTRAAGTVPAAVVSIGISRGRRWAATRMAW